MTGLFFPPVSRLRAVGRGRGAFFVLLGLAFLFAVPASSSLAAGASSEAAALSRLGELLLDGRHLAYDPVQARTYFAKAEALGDQTARLRLAEMTLRGVPGGTDADHALKDLIEIAAGGNDRALVSLGDIYARGYAGFVDRAAAMAAYEKAAQSGNATAALRLADIHRYGLFGTENQGLAYAWLEKASALNNSYALYLMGTGLLEREFRRFGTPQAGLERLREAGSKGVSDAVIELAIRRDTRMATKLPKRELMATLESMAKDGNTEAALYLFDSHLDAATGRNQRLSPGNLKNARQQLEAAAPDLEPGQMDYRRLLLDVLSARPSDYDILYPRIRNIAPEQRPSLMRRILRGNPNAFFQLVQRRLAESSHYAGRPNGLLDRRTITAINDYCASLGDTALCRNGPLSPPTTFLLVHSF